MVVNQLFADEIIEVAEQFIDEPIIMLQDYHLYLCPGFIRDRRALVEQIGRRIIDNRLLYKYRAYEMNPGDKIQSDEEWLQWARETGQTTYHVIGTCKMGPDPMAVVDDSLRVRGLDGLRVIDASIMPTVPSGNTNAAVIAMRRTPALLFLKRISWPCEV